MKILMFGWEFPPHISGGLGTACFGLTKGLAKHGVDMIFVVPRAYGDEDQEAVRLVNASDITVNMKNSRYKEYWKRIEYMEIGSNIIPYVSPEEFERIHSQEELNKISEESHVFADKFEFAGGYGTSLLEEVSRYALVASALATSKDFDLIHSHDWLTYPAGIAAKYVSGKPLVIHVHATEFDRSGENVNPPVFEIERKGMEEADKIIAVSNFTRNIIIEKYGIPEEKVVTVHNAVEPAEIKEINGAKYVPEKIVTFLGRITFQKGPDYFIEAARLVLERDPNVRFVMAGSGDLLEKMIRRVAELRMGDKFHFTGFLKGTAVDRMLAMSDVFVMPSVSEPFGIVPLEAMRSNVPVVISKQSGVSEVLKHALKVDFWDVHGMADAIYSVLHYNGLNRMFTKYGKDEVESLKWEHAGLKVKDVYEEMLKK
ncbi:MAG: glycosyltransferase family 4 protein [Bacteroidales bacterium]|jgi:glycosyltransferase involved in cell wall biosynthesis|nr:glycosyltransferase family 4 protein [Bacteroidales bacterium]